VIAQAGASVDNLSMSDAYTLGGTAILTNSGTVTSATMRSVKGTFSGTGSSIVQLLGSGTIPTLHWDGIEQAAGNSLLITASTTPQLYLRATNVYANGPVEVISGYSPVTADFGNLHVNNTGWICIAQNAASAVVCNIDCYERTGTGSALIAINAGRASANVAPQWYKATKTYADFSTAATTNSLTILPLVAGGTIHNVRIKQSTSFSGGSISAYTVGVGIVGDTGRYGAAFDVFQAVGNSTQQLSQANSLSSPSGGSTVNIAATATSTGANLSAATAGSVDIWLLVSYAQ
jgi:hypothetical protein